MATCPAIRIAEAELVVGSASYIDDLTLTFHAHSTLPEGIEQAAGAVEKKAIHLFNLYLIWENAL